ncbi:MAG TPA: hypothetical protein VE988_12050 [Gemmataceae bacterium]|nr:hypothetical protein [Gemmataceae bacterium]
MSTVTAGDLQPIAVAALSLNVHVREMATQMLINFGLKWKCARDVLLKLVSHPNGKIRWTAITHVPYRFAYQPKSFPQDFILEFLRNAMKDKIAKHRQFAYEGVRTFFRPDLLPEIRAGLATESKKEIIDGLTELVPFLERGFYFVSNAGFPGTDKRIRVFLEDGTFLEETIPLDLPISDVRAIVDSIRKKPLHELKAAQAAFETKLLAERRARDLAQAQKAEEARSKGLVCPKCGFTYKWDGVHCGHCKYQKE